MMPTERRSKQDERKNCPCFPSGSSTEAPPSHQENNEFIEPENSEFINSINGWLMTVAALLMNMAFTAGLNIPGGAWSSSSQFYSATTSNAQTDDPRHTAGQPIIMNIDRYRYYILMLFDVIAFACSMSIIILLLFKKSPKHRRLKIRNLLVYAMVMIAIVYILGCAPYSGFIVFIIAVGATFTVIQLSCGSILCHCLIILWDWLTKSWGGLKFLWDKWDALWNSLWTMIFGLPQFLSYYVSGAGGQQAATASQLIVSGHEQC